MSTAIVLAALVAAFFIGGLLVSEYLCRDRDGPVPRRDIESTAHKAYGMPPEDQR
ncbi:hypothetical protein [Novosphingobium sp. Gsoil 351]|uniref:hypothetical protein n=1 Tax=Novosphingobium sp. Gsoil 351 TaxID=2675225 RepID=UPI0012B480C9|nr:hypothetical protein [Novosphingobium sp. Gsoil 351]QGN54629.1 hypothetical protein GKE62_08735 [Novosphingobium sp. Gsoil 351]